MAKKDGNGTTAVAVPTPYAILKSSLQELQVLLGELGPLDPFSGMDRLKVPTGGGTTWQVPTLRGEESAKEMTGVILFIKPTRSFRRESFDETGGGTPPDCSSDDLIEGVGDPGGLCVRCPFNQWGSLSQLNPKRDDSQGKACRETRLLFLILPNKRIPLIIVVPPSSLSGKFPGTVQKYLLGLASEGLAPWAVETTLSLHTEKMGKFPTAIIRATLARELPAEEAARFRAVANAFRPVMERVIVAREDVDGAPEA